MSTTVTPQDFTSCANRNESEQRNKQNVVVLAEEPVNQAARDQKSRLISDRNTSGRCRFIDPTASDRNDAEAETEFMEAMQLYKQTSGRMFPTWCEVLEVLKGLGYKKIGPDTV